MPELTDAARVKLSLPSLQGQYDTATSQQAEGREMFQRGVQRREQATAEYKPKLEAAAGQMRDVRQQMAGEKLEQVEVPTQFQHGGMSQEDVQQSMGAFMALAAIGGMMTRQPMTAALNSFAAAMQGLQKGDAELFNREKDQFDRTLKAVSEKNKMLSEKYKAAIERHKGNLAGLESEVRMLALEHNDTVALADLERTGGMNLMNHAQSLQSSAVQADIQNRNAQARMAQAHEHFKAQQEAHRLDRESRERLAADRIAAQERMTSERLATQAKIAAEKAKAKGTESGLKGKMLESYVHNESNIAAIDDMIEAIKQNPDALGFKQLIPGLVLNRFDPEGTPVRASVANVRSMVIKDRAGTAQTVGEMRNLSPFLPNEGDDWQTQITKLEGMKREMQRINSTTAGMVGKPGGTGGAPRYNDPAQPPQGFKPL